jgi:nitrogen fixation NifU-like protein
MLDHFEHPRNSGELPDADVGVRLENPVCGDILELSAKIENGVIREIRFRAKGCVPAIACGSALTELVKTKTVAEARSINKKDVVQAIGALPEASGHAAQLAIDGLRELLRKLE